MKAKPEATGKCRCFWPRDKHFEHGRLAITLSRTRPLEMVRFNRPVAGFAAAAGQKRGNICIRKGSSVKWSGGPVQTGQVLIIDRVPKWGHTLLGVNHQRQGVRFFLVCGCSVTV